MSMEESAALNEPAVQGQDPVQDEAPHKRYIRALPQIERDRLGHMVNVSGAYVTSLIYRDANTLSLSMAIAIDKHSNGALDFRDLVARREIIDWDYVRVKLIAGR